MESCITWALAGHTPASLCCIGWVKYHLHAEVLSAHLHVRDKHGNPQECEAAQQLLGDRGLPPTVTDGFWVKIRSWDPEA